jgi:hypothetical protein
MIFDFASLSGSPVPHYALFVIPYAVQPELVLAERRRPYVGLPVAPLDSQDLLRVLHNAADGIADILLRSDSEFSCDIADEFDDVWNKQPGHFIMLATSGVLAKSRHHTGAFVRHEISTGEKVTIGQPDTGFDHFEKWVKAGRPVLAHAM